MKTLTNKHGHLEGFCSLQFFANDHKIATCGKDSLIKIHNLDVVDEDESEIVIDHFENPVNAIAIRHDAQVIAAGGEDRDVVILDLTTSEFIGNVTRCTLPIRDLCFAPNSSMLAVASDDTSIKIINTDKTEEVKTLEGHFGGVKSLSFDPKGKFLASTSSDCTLRIWDVETGDEKHCIKNVFSRNSASATTESGDPVNLCKCAWNKDGSILAVAGGPEVKVYERDTWKEQEAFIGGNGKDISSLAFCPNGVYLLTVDVGGYVVTWDVTSRESVTRHENSSRVLCGQWDPFMNQIGLIAEDGSFGVVNDVIPTDRLGPHDNLDDDDEVDMDEDVQSFGAGEEDKLDDLEVIKSGGKGDVDTARRAAPVFNVKPQAAFQPQSTPLEHKRRFMAYTSYGYITCRAEASYNSIEVEFADIERHRPIRFSDYQGFTMAALGDVGAVFASPETIEGGSTTASCVYYRPFDSWAPQSDWQLHMNVGEEVTALAIGSVWVAVATSKKMLRIFSFSGVQLQVYSLPGPCVCMSGKDEMLGVAHHMASSPSPTGDQALEFQLMDVRNKKLLARGPLCISPGAQLEWFSVQQTGMISSLDSEGFVRMYSQALMGGQWSPVLDIKIRNKTRDWFWPIGIDRNYLTGVVCKIEKRYPDVLQPVVTRFELEVPLLKADVEEEKWHRHSMFVTHDALQGDDEDMSTREMDLDKSLLQLFNVACQQEKLFRALDLAMLMHTEKAVTATITLANRHHLPALAEKIDVYRQTAFPEEEEEELEEEEQEEEEYDNRARQHSRNESNIDQRAPKRPKYDAESPEAGASDDEDAREAVNMETPPTAAAPKRTAASIFSIKNSNGNGAGKSSGGGNFMDKIKNIAQKSETATASRPKLLAVGTGFGKGKKGGLGVSRKK